MKKTIILFVLLILSGVIFLIIFNLFQKSIIDLDSNYLDFITMEEYISKGHKSVIPEYDSDSSIGYLNQDGTKTIYIFSSPIKYKNKLGQFINIDTRISNVENTSMIQNGYKYTVANSDIQSYYPRRLTPEQGIKLEQDVTSYEFGIYANEANAKYINKVNFINDNKNMVLYKNIFDHANLFVYPSNLGTNCEIHINNSIDLDKLSFWLKINSNQITVKKQPGGYITLSKKTLSESGERIEKIVGVIQKPLIKNNLGNISYNCDINIAKDTEGKYRIDFLIDKNFSKKDSTVFLSFEMKRDNQPDNAIYSNHPNLEYAYLKNYSVIGNSSDNGVGRLMIRYVFAKHFALNSSEIKQANYYVYSLTNNSGSFEMIRILEDWCSITGNWNKNYKTGERISFFEKPDKILNFDITKEVIYWCDSDERAEQNEVQLKKTDEKEGVCDVLLSNDNTLYRNRTEIILK